MKNLASVILLLSLFSCSPERRLYRLLKANPELSKHDTVISTISVLVPSVTTDTVFSNTITTDTITITKDNLKIKYYNDGKTVYLKGVCDTVTVYKDVPTFITTISPAKEVTVYPIWAWIALGVALMFLLLAGLDIYHRHRND